LDEHEKCAGGRRGASDRLWRRSDRGDHGLEIVERSLGLLARDDQSLADTQAAGRHLRQEALIDDAIAMHEHVTAGERHLEAAQRCAPASATRSRPACAANRSAVSSRRWKMLPLPLVTASASATRSRNWSRAKTSNSDTVPSGSPQDARWPIVTLRACTTPMPFA
jgi:hypothetical protein